MMKRSIYFRNFMATALLVLISYVVLGCLFTVWSYRIVRAEQRGSMMSTLREAAKIVSAQSISSGFQLDAFVMRMQLATISGSTGFDLLLADHEGIVVSCSDTEPACRHLGEEVPEQFRLSAVSGSGTDMTTTLGGIYGHPRHVAGMALEVKINGERVVYGYIIISSDSALIREAWNQFTGVFIMIALIVLCVTFFVSLLTTKKQAEPLNEMARAAHRFARGDFSVRVKEVGRIDEIGQLTQAFNTMADALESSETLRREFIANISHELKTPMTVIAGFADGILDGTIPPENEAKYLNAISSETRRLSRLVRSMLELSTLQSAERDEILRGRFDIAEVLRLALLSLGGKIDDRGLDVLAELPEEPVITCGDRDSITQVAFNLLDNAVKFSSHGGTIKVSLWKQGAKAFISVENSGETISEAEMPLIFDRFHKADKSRSISRDGVGLGLYIVKTILDNHNEDIFVTSRDGVTRFTFTLTIAEK